MGIGDIINSITRLAETAADGVSETFFEPVIRLGVSGLSRSGKTVFITSLVANILDRGRMLGFSGVAQGKIIAAYLQPQPDDTLPRFEYESHLSAMTGENPIWPKSTRRISQLRLSLRIQPTGMISGFRSPRTVHIDIVDYPGEWLLDLPMMEQSFEEWSEQALELARNDVRIKMSKPWLDQLDKINTEEKFNELVAQKISTTFTNYLSKSRDAGFSSCTPGRFLMPGDLDGSPVLTFTPLDKNTPRRGSLYREFGRRFEVYKSKVIRPFFENHFSRIDRQIVLLDVLGAIHAGPQAVNDLRKTMSAILSCYKVGSNGFFAPFLGRKVEKILFAATKADHLHHTQHTALSNIVDVLVSEAKNYSELLGVETSSIAIASLRATVEETIKHNGKMLDCVRGTLLDTKKEVAMYPGELPSDPMDIFRPGRDGAIEWLDNDYAIMQFAPAKIKWKLGDGPPHIRLDRVAEFLLGDKL